jgi:hypothetical protein
MALGVAFKIAWSDIGNAPFVYIAWRDQVFRDQVAQPCRSKRVDLVVIGHHADFSALSAGISSLGRCRAQWLISAVIPHLPGARARSSPRSRSTT